MRVVSRIRRVVQYILYLYVAGIDNLPVHLGYHSTNNDWRVSLQLFNSYNNVNEHEELDIWLTESADFGVSKHFRFKHLLISPEMYKLKSESVVIHSCLLLQWLKTGLDT